MLWQYPCKCSYPDCMCLFWLVSLWLIVWLEKSQWKNWVFDPELKWLSMQCKIMEAVSFESMECFPKSKLSCYRGDRKIHSSERNQYWIFGTDISRYFPQKTVTKSWRCYKPNMCYIFSWKISVHQMFIKIVVMLNKPSQWKEIWTFKTNLYILKQKDFLGLLVIFLTMPLQCLLHWIHLSSFAGFLLLWMNSKWKTCISFLNCSFCKNDLKLAASGIKPSGLDGCKGISEFYGNIQSSTGNLCNAVVISTVEQNNFWELDVFLPGVLMGDGREETHLQRTISFLKVVQNSGGQSQYSNILPKRIPVRKTNWKKSGNVAQRVMNKHSCPSPL